MTNTSETLKVVKVEDHEGDGECRACGRTGLRWIVTLSDGSQIGTECAKRLLGIRIAPKSVEWVSRFVAVEERIEYGVHFVLWQSKGGKAGAISQGGHQITSGPWEWVAKEFARRYA